jgi:translation initiation factor 1A
LPKRTKKSSNKNKRKRSRGPKGPVTEGESRVYQPKLGEILGVVIRILGGNHIEVMSADGYRRTIRIPGKIRRRVWVKANDLVVIEPWYGMDEIKKGDLKYRYRPTEIIRLARNRRYIADLEKLQVTIPKIEEFQGGFSR